MENCGSGVFLVGLRHPSLVASAAPLGFGICVSPPPLHRETRNLELAFVPPLLRFVVYFQFFSV